MHVCLSEATRAGDRNHTFFGIMEVFHCNLLCDVASYVDLLAFYRPMQSIRGSVSEALYRAYCTCSLA